MFSRLKAPREKLRPYVRSVLLWLAVGCVGTILVTVLAEFFVKWAEEAGWYSNPSQRAGRFISAMVWFLTSWWFIAPTIFIIGLAAGAWIDWLLRSWGHSPTMTVRDLARSLDDFHAEGTRERNRVIPAIEDFDYGAERAKLVEWKKRLLEKLDVDHINPAEYSAIRTLKDFAGWAHNSPNKTGQQHHIEAMWNEHLSRLQAIIHRLSGLPPPAVRERPSSPLEVTFNPDDDRHVKHRNGVTRFYVGVHNASDTRTIESVTLCALDGSFATDVLAAAHGRINPATGRQFERDPILGEWAQINPGVTEYIELFGINAELMKQCEYDEPITRRHQFILEVRARDTPKAMAQFEYDPSRTPIMTRLA
jgi:hypothetical protein